jgi:prenylcysteine oxidase / farnesylcysteine lyase
MVDNVTQELEEYALDQFVAQSATRYLDEARVSQRYSSDLTDTCTRTRFLRALPIVHSLVALMAAQERLIGPIRGGNRRLVERLIEISNSRLRLDTYVIKIGPGQSHRYKVTYSEQSSPEQSSPKSNLAESQEFDYVIIAAPLHTANIDLGSLSNFDTAALPQYSDVHVTHFPAPAELSPSFFNLSSEATMTDDIMVTAHASEFFDLYSISRSWEYWIDDEFCYPGQLCDQVVYENLYRVVSRERIDDIDLIGMIGGNFHNNTPLHEQNMSWVHRQAWLSAVPAHRPDATLPQQVQMAPGLFYLCGAEGIISSMEMSCRMGKNVAKRLYYGL